MLCDCATCCKWRVQPGSRATVVVGWRQVAFIRLRAASFTVYSMLCMCVRAYVCVCVFLWLNKLFRSVFRYGWTQSGVRST